jgi:starch synthase
MRVLFAAAECVPFVKTGGLADVVGALPGALGKVGAEARVLLPRYGSLALDVDGFEKAAAFDDLFGGPATVLAGRAAGVNVLLLDAPHLFGRDGNPYVRTDGTDWPDNAQRFAGLSRAAALIARDGVAGWRPDLVHAHDWHTGLVPDFLAVERVAVPSVLTLHNVAYQGLFPASAVEALGLSAARFTNDGFDHYGRLSFLKAGITAASKVTTVSPTYATELATPEFGMGLDGAIVARGSDMVGILNGIDTDSWNPETDPDLAAPFSAQRPRMRAKNKTALLKAFGLKAKTNAFLLCVISRLTGQKGLDLLPDIVPRLTELGIHIVVLGAGDTDLEAALRTAAEAHPQTLRVRFGYDAALARLMHGGADAILVPSRFEPCGLTQLCGLRYGTVPIVTRTGGLADTIIDANAAALTADCATGIQFQPATAPAMAAAVQRAHSLYQDKKTWRRLVRRAMRHPVGWETSAQTYADVYREAVCN